MSKHLAMTAAAAALFFLAGWSFKPDSERTARATRESAAAVPDPELEKLNQELASERARTRELEEELRALKGQREERGLRGPAETGAEAAKGPRFLFPEHEKVLQEIDWEEVGTSTAKLAPLLAELLDTLEKTGEIPPTLVAEIQKWNAQLVAVAIKVDAAGLPGHGVNGSFTHPAVDVNVIHATLRAGGHALSAEQEERLGEIGRRYADEEARRSAGYAEGTLELRKIAEEAAVKDRFYEEVDALLTTGQRDFLHPESVRGMTQLDLFSSGIMTYLEMRPLDVKDREVAVKLVTEKHLEKLGLDPASRPVVEQLVRGWAEKVSEAGLDAPREKAVSMPLLTRSARVRKAAQLQLELWDEIQRRVPMTEEQKRKLAAETNIVVPFR